MQLRSPKTLARIRSAFGAGLVACLLAGLGVLTPQAGAVAGFGDVAEDKYFAKPVQWALNTGIVERTDACFAPNALATRGESVVYLWRMAGRPAAAPHTFSDVPTKSRNAAVSWAAQTGITRGTSESTFSPEAAVTRGELAAFLYRLADSPAAPRHSFDDVVAPWQQAPVSWMLHSGITTGTSATTFSPEMPLTRAQLVTFLYRYRGAPNVRVDPGGDVCCSSTQGAAHDPCGIHDELARLIEIARDWDRSAQTSISVVLSDGSVFGAADEVRAYAASAVKPMWTAAAIDAVGAAAVAGPARKAIVFSDNHAAGDVIDLAGGIDAVNKWVDDVAGLESTHLSFWGFGKRRVSYLGLGRTRTSMRDLAMFYVRLHQGRLLDRAGTEQLRSWLLATPRKLSYVDGALLDRLPQETAATALHKTGWLPPGCCVNDYRLINDAGLVVLPNGDWYAMAISSSQGHRYDRSVRWLGYAACRIHAVVSDDSSLDCRRSGDPPVG